MKVAISIEVGSDLRAQVCPSFGRAPRYVVHDSETGGLTVLENTAASGAHGAGTGAAALMAQHGVETVISGRFGPNAYQALKAAGIRMFVSVSDANAGAALERLQAGSLKEASPA